MSNLDFELPEPEIADKHRPGFGWAMFFTVLVLFIGIQLAGYLTRDGSKAESAVKEVRTSIKTTYLYEEAMRRMRQPDAFKPFDSSISTLAPLRKSDPSAALLWVILRDLRGHDIAQEDIKLILKGKGIDRRAFAAIYGSKTLTPSRADSLVAKLPGGFPSRLAWRAALRKTGVEEPARRVFTDREVFTPVIVLGVLRIAGIAGVILLLAFIVAKAAGKLPPKGFPANAVSPAHADRLAGKVAVILVLSMTLPAFLIVPLAGKMNRAGQTALATVLLLACALALVRVPLFGRRITWAELGWRRDQVGKDALSGLAAALANAPLLLLVSVISGFLFRWLPPAEHPITSDLSRMNDPWMLAATFFAASVVAPIVEETLFRGMLAPAMGTLFERRWVGWIAAGLCFAAIHPTGIPAWPALATLGVVASITNYQTGSLVSSVFMHGFHNAIILTMAIFVLG